MTETAPLERIQELVGRTRIPWERVGVVCETGSTAFGITSESSDLDATMVWTESLRDLVAAGGPKRDGSRMLRTRPDGKPSGPGDIDLQIYTMRRFASLAAGGNPSILAALFTVPEHRLYSSMFPADRLISLTRSRRAGTAFLGYLDSQFSKWDHNEVRRRVNRPELIEKYGYDVKYATHAIRLGIQGAEYLSTGRITMPIPEPAAARLRGVRAGLVPEEEALALCVQVRGELVAALDASTLPDHPDMDALHGFLTDWHEAWL